MPLILDILVNITGPIIVLIGLGWALGPRLEVDGAMLNRVLIHVVLPGFLAHYLATSSVPLAAAWTTAWFTGLMFFVLAAVGWIVAAAFGFRGSVPPLVALATTLPNSGNFGLPLVELAFGPDMILHQAVIVSVQSVLIFTIGLAMLKGGSGGWRQGAKAFLSPVFPAILIGLALNGFDVTLPRLVALPLEMLGRLYTPLALFALGVQLASGRGRWLSGPLALSGVLKLLAAPVLTWFAVILLGLEGTLGDLLIVTAAAPVGVTVAIVAAQAGRETELAAAGVFATTLLCPVTVTLCLYLLRAG